MTSTQKLEELECKRHTYSREKTQLELQSSFTILAESAGKEIKIIHFETATKVNIDKQIVCNTEENFIVMRCGMQATKSPFK